MHRKDFKSFLSQQDEDFILDPYKGSLGAAKHQLQKICFPSLKEIKNQIEIERNVIKLKKIVFMDALHTTILPGDQDLTVPAKNS